MRLIPVMLAFLAVAACGGGEEAAPTPQQASPPPPPTGLPPAPPAEASAPTGAEAPAGGGILVNVINGDPAGPTKAYKFVMDKKDFKVGDTVTFTVTAETELHNFSVEGLEIDQDADVGKPVSLTYTFNTAGTFKVFCLFHEANGMTDKITVTD